MYFCLLSNVLVVVVNLAMSGEGRIISSHARTHHVRVIVIWYYVVVCARAPLSIARRMQLIIYENSIPLGLRSTRRRPDKPSAAEVGAFVCLSFLSLSIPMIFVMRVQTVSS